MATIQKGQILREDLENWDGVTKTATRIDATGGTITGVKIGDAVDVLMVYGAGTAYTDETINKALEAIATSNVSFVFATGTWVIDADVTIPANITCEVPPGCIFNISAGKTLTLNGYVFSKSETINSGAGTLTTANSIFNPQIIPRSAGEVTAGITPTNYEYPPGNALRYGAVGDGVADDTTALQNMLDIGLNDNIPAYLPGGKYKTTAPLETHHGTLLYGDGHYDNATGFRTQIYGVHTGSAVLLMKRNLRCVIRDIEIIGDSTTQPKTGIAVGRGAVASAGQHHFYNLAIGGCYSEASIYSIASEENIWDNCRVELDELSNGLYTFYTSQADGLSVATFTGSSNVVGTVKNCTFNNKVDNVAAAIIYMGCGSITREWAFRDCYLIGANGYAVRLKLDDDGGDIKGPIVFDLIGGEPYTGGGAAGTTHGFYITGAGPRVLAGLKITNFRHRGDTTLNYSLETNSNVTLENCVYDVLLDSADLSFNGIVMDAITNSTVRTNEAITYDTANTHGSDIWTESRGYITEELTKSGSYDIASENHKNRKIYNNRNSAGQTTYTLDAALRGDHMTFINTKSGWSMRIDPDGTENFRGEAAGKYMSLDSEGAYVIITCVETGIWDYISRGTITFEP